MMEFMSDHWGKLLFVLMIVSVLLFWPRPSKYRVNYQEAASNMAETQKCIEFLKTCTDEQALVNWATVQSYIMGLCPAEWHQIEMALLHVNRGDGAAGRLVKWVRQESGRLYDMA